MYYVARLKRIRLACTSRLLVGALLDIAWKSKRFASKHNEVLMFEDCLLKAAGKVIFVG